MLLIKLIIPFSFETKFNPIPSKFMEFSNKTYIEENVQNKETIPNLEGNREEMVKLNDNEIVESPIQFKENATKKNKLTIKKIVFLIFG